MTVILRPDLGCCGESEDEYGQNRGDADIGGGLNIGNVATRVGRPFARSAEEQCFRAETSTPLTVKGRRTWGTDLDVEQIHRGLHHAMSFALLNATRCAGDHALSIA